MFRADDANRGTDTIFGLLIKRAQAPCLCWASGDFSRLRRAGKQPDQDIRKNMILN